MKTNRKTIRVLALSLAMAVVLLLPSKTNAQSDGFFRDTGGDYSNRDAGTMGGNEFFGMVGYIGYGSSNETFNTTDAPLGSGLLLLTALGAGHAVLRKRK